MSREKLQDHLAYPPRLLRADRAAAYLDMGERTFLRLVSEGKLPKPKRGLVVSLRGTVIAWMPASTTPTTMWPTTPSIGS